MAARVNPAASAGALSTGANPALRGIARSDPAGWVALAAGAVVWEAAARIASQPFLPPLSRVLVALWELTASGQIVGSLAASVAGLVVGFGAACLVGVTVGGAMGRSRTVEHLLDVYLYALLATPSLVFVPVLFAIFGVSRASQTAVVFLHAVLVIAANTMAGVKAADRQLVEMARSFGASERQVFWRVIIPGAAPLVGAGLRIGMGRAVRGMVNGEMFIALTGLGALLRIYGSRFEADRVLAVLLVVLVVALASTRVVDLLARRLSHVEE